MNTGSSCTTLHFENGEQVYPCRCGETHRGDYALYDWGHHNCLHDSGELHAIAEDQFMCPECGKSFVVAW
jgi:hypothetical protein